MNIRQIRMLPTARQKTKTRPHNSVAWRKASAAFLQRYPLCVLCLARGQINERAMADLCTTQRTLVVDHIEPHRGDDSLFWNTNNWQTLCRLCHDVDKQRHEQRGLGRNEWVRRLRAEALMSGSIPYLKKLSDLIPEILMAQVIDGSDAKRYVIYGPPCSGKTTWVKERAADNDFVWDFDRVARKMFGRDSRTGITHGERLAVMDAREQWLRKIAINKGDAYWIATHKEDAERVAAVIGAELIAMDTPQEVCLERCLQEPDTPHRQERLDAIQQWFDRECGPSHNGTNIHNIGAVSPRG